VEEKYPLSCPDCHDRAEIMRDGPSNPATANGGDPA